MCDFGILFRGLLRVNAEPAFEGGCFLVLRGFDKMAWHCHGVGVCVVIAPYLVDECFFRIFSLAIEACAVELYPFTHIMGCRVYSLHLGYLLCTLTLHMFQRLRRQSEF